MSDFTHLHVHTHYSLLDGLGKIDPLLEKAHILGMDALAITDHGNMYGVIEFYKKARELGIKPIIGCELYISPRKMTDKTAKIDTSPFHITLLAKNQEGYLNLIQLVTQAHLVGYYYKPRIDKELLKKHSKGLVALSGCLQGELPRLILSQNTKEAEEKAKDYEDIFGKGNFYIEIQGHTKIEDQNKANKGLIKISKKTGIPLVATSDVHYINSEDAEAQDVLLCVQMNKTVQDKNRMSMLGEDFSLKSESEIKKLFPDNPEAIANTKKIADMCNLEIELGNSILPKFSPPKNYDENQYLQKLSYEGLERRFNIELNYKDVHHIQIETKNLDEKESELIKRLDYELQVIEKTGFANYFLIVADFVNWAKNQGIMVGPGRGSAAGSLVSYCLKVTDIDPLAHDLLFERFLNPERISMPDIDLDFADDRRDEVIKYVVEKYGQDKVAQIITFGTMAARNAIRDCGRALGLGYSFVDRIAKMIQANLHLEEALKKIPELENEYKKDPQVKKLIDLAKKLEGVVRHASTHAAGVVITDKPLTNYLPLQKATKGETGIITQYSMYELEDLGLLKMDFLGLANLTIIQNALKIIAKTQNKEIDLEKIPADDLLTFSLLSKGDTVGVFQFECLSGDTIVSNTTIKNLYQKKDKKRLESVYLDEGKIHKNKIIDILEGKKKNIYILIAENNRYIKASEDHYFLTESGWKKLKNIKKGEKILIKMRAKHLIYNTCQICGKEIDGQKEGKSNFCYHCSASFYKNSNKKKSRKKIQKAMLKFFRNGGKPWNIGMKADNNKILRKTGKKISKALSGRSLEDLWGKEKADKFKKAHSQRNRGSNNPMFGKPTPHRKGGFRRDLGHYVRSNWEADFARILKKHHVRYEYEPRIFKLVKPSGEIIHYCPDFYVKHNNTFYEIKGWLHNADQEKIKLFQQQYPQYNFVLISATKFAEFALKYKNLINWECPRIPIKKSFQFIKVKEIKYSGKETTYDIAMESPGNNFVANGFLVHNSEGMKRYLKELKPSTFEDIISMVALYRPGPMESIPDFIEGKHGRREITYLHPKLKPILEKTYGIIVTQEQVLQIARDVAGFSYGEADILRKAVGKKIHKLLIEQQKKFINGAIDNGVSKDIAKKLWDFIEPFASYGFNKSHASCYAQIAYWTAYLKAHYPAEFMAALLTSDEQNIDRITIEVAECQRMGIEILSPNVNESFENFTVINDNNIRFGLGAIKNVGTGSIAAIVEARKTEGTFKDLEDFCRRAGFNQINKKVLESLIKSGAMDEFGERGQLMIGVEAILKYANLIQKKTSSGQIALFDGGVDEAAFDKLELPEVDKIPDRQKLSWEKELLGVYLSGHPLAQFGQFLKENATPISGLNNNHDGARTRIGGMISKVHKIMTRSGEQMAFVTIEDEGNSLEVIVFPKMLASNPTIWQEGGVIMVAGKVNLKDGQLKILVDKVQEIGEQMSLNDEMIQENSTDEFQNDANKNGSGDGQKKLYLTIPKSGTKELLLGLKKVLLKYLGENPVYLLLPEDGSFKEVKIKTKIEVCEGLLNELKELLTGDKIDVR